MQSTFHLPHRLSYTQLYTSYTKSKVYTTPIKKQMRFLCQAHLQIGKIIQKPSCLCTYRSCQLFGRKLSAKPNTIIWRIWGIKKNKKMIITILSIIIIHVFVYIWIFVNLTFKIYVYKYKWITSFLILVIYMFKYFA